MKLYEIPDAMMKRLDDSFTYHSPKDTQSDRYQELRTNAHRLALDICNMVPPGREQSLAITKLEETIMWANKGIACGEL